MLGKSWLFDAVPGGEPTAAMLDAVVSNRPVLLDANDYHSTWVNSVGLEALGITDDTPDHAGGRIARDADGHATGFLEETAAEQIAWAHLDRITTAEQHRSHLGDAMTALHAAGITAVIVAPVSVTLAIPTRFGPAKLLSPMNAVVPSCDSAKPLSA